jgi:hypothetical protein
MTELWKFMFILIAKYVHFSYHYDDGGHEAVEEAIT